MGDSSVNVLRGIGPKTSALLNAAGILTISQLADATPSDIPNITRAQHFIDLAKRYLADAKIGTLTARVVKSTFKQLPSTTTVKDVETPKSIVAKDQSVLVEASTQPQQQDIVEFKYLITDHSWFEHTVMIPTEKNLRKAAVYELSIEPNERIALICMSVEDDDDTVTTHVVSPQLVYHFNLDLPPLKVYVQPEDFAKLKNKETLEQVLKEVNLMRRYSEVR